jgi:O-antigen/teichoic acid export membrane protein
MRGKMEPTRTSAPKRASNFRTGLIWNLGSLAFLALAGFALNIVIGRVYGAAQLGNFNICFAFFIVVSQVGSFGLHLSALQSVSEHWDMEAGRAASAIREAFVLCLATTSIGTLLWLLLLPLVSRFYGDPDFTTSWLLLTPGLFFFSLNKVLLNAVNGANHMRAFALLQALRYILILAFVALALHQSWPSARLTLIMTLAEVLLFAPLAAYVLSILPARPAADREMRRRHLAFGLRSCWSGAVIELNTRVDVLILGALIGAEAAGIYTIAGLFAEGLAMLIFALRSMVNPLVGRALSQARPEEVAALCRRSVRMLTPVMAAASLMVLLLFPTFIEIAFGDDRFSPALSPLLWLLCGLTLSSGWLVFNMLFLLANRPAWHTLYMTMVLGVNVVLSMLLVPGFGLAGAGMASGGTSIAAAILLIILARRVAGVRLAP